jgi:hypothetical protein
MLKTLTLFCFALATITSYAQQTQTPITGIDSIQLGDSINRINAYGFPFIAVTKYFFSDTLIAEIKAEKRKGYDYRYFDLRSDSGKTFCPDVSVFITNSFSFNEIPHSKIATLALTYFKNELIEIRIIDSPNRIKHNYTYGIKHYGKSFVYKLNEYTIHSQKRNLGVNPTDKIPPLKDYSNFPIDTIAKELKERNEIETIYWENGNNSFAYNVCSEPFTFWDNKIKPNRNCAHCGCAEEAIIIKNDKAYKAMTDCSINIIKQFWID